MLVGKALLQKGGTMRSKDAHIQMSELMKKKIFIPNLSKDVITLNSQGNENVRSHYSYMAIVSAIICSFSFKDEEKKDACSQRSLSYTEQIFFRRSLS